MKQEGAVGSGGGGVLGQRDGTCPILLVTHTHLQEEEGSHSRQEAEKAPQTKGRWGWHSEVPVWRSPRQWTLPVGWSRTAPGSP